GLCIQGRTDLAALSGMRSGAGFGGPSGAGRIVLMGGFKSERRMWTEMTDLEPVVQHVTAHLQAKGYGVGHQRTAARAWDIDITRSGVFRTISGMRTALKVRLEPDNGSVMARAGIGILGQQALPTVVSMLVFWPILVGQIWGAVQSSKVDDE